MLGLRHSATVQPWLVFAVGMLPVVGIEAFLEIATGSLAFGWNDGLGFRALARIFQAYVPPFTIDALNPLAGMGGPLTPINIWANPGYWPFLALAGRSATVLSVVLSYLVLAAAVFALLRALTIPARLACAAAQATVLVFPPFYLALGFHSQFWLIPPVAVALATTLVALASLFATTLAWRSVATHGALIAAVIGYGLYCDPVWGSIYPYTLAPAFVFAVLAAGSRRAIGRRIGALLLAGALLFASGFASSILSFAADNARSYFDAEMGRVQVPANTSMLFASYGVPLFFYVVVAAGSILAVVRLRGRPRLVGVMALVCMAWLAAQIFVYLFTRFRWFLPVPLYAENSYLPLYIATTTVGWAALWPSARARMAETVGDVPGGGESGAAAARGVRAPWGLLIVPAFMLALLPHWRSLWADSHADLRPDISTLVERLAPIALAPGKPFHGKLAMIESGQWIEEFTRIGLLGAGIPMLNEYSGVITPEAYYFVSRLLLSGGAGGSSRLAFDDIDRRVFRVLGVAGMLNLDQGGPLRARYGSLVGHFRLTALDDPNTGDYSPTKVMVSRDAKETMAHLRDPTFDFRRDVVLVETLKTPLVAARSGAFTFARGGIHVTGTSDGVSLLLLPIQYSHCLAPDQRDGIAVLRADFGLAAVLFDKRLDARIHDLASIVDGSCRWQDVADMRALGAIPDRGRRPLADVLPDRLTRWGDLPVKLEQLAGKVNTNMPAADLWAWLAARLRSPDRGAGVPARAPQVSTFGSNYALTAPLVLNGRQPTDRDGISFGALAAVVVAPPEGGRFRAFLSLPARSAGGADLTLVLMAAEGDGRRVPIATAPATVHVPAGPATTVTFDRVFNLPDGWTRATIYPRAGVGPGQSVTLNPAAGDLARFEVREVGAR
ncbi:MAG TPA: hypothetical protein VMA53_21190 [Stellaceae bacterium]|nr:hypothetical protein [Stellaceae bacterium]